MKLWNRNFTIITLGTVVSAIGGAAMSIALGLVVFDNTDSALSTAFYMAMNCLPQVLVPLLLAPTIDHCRRKPVIVGLDYLTGVIYAVFGVYALVGEFSYGAYLALGVLSGTIGSVYGMTYSSLYPDLIPEGKLQQGYAVSSLIYPSATVIMSPVAAVVYASYGIEWLFFAEGALLLIAATFEIFIRVDESQADGKLRLKPGQLVAEWRDGLRYLKQEKGIRSLYSYMAVTNATGNGNGLMVMAYFQTTSGLTTAMYSLLISAETIGRAVGGVVHYFVKIPDEKKFRLTERVYFAYEIADGAMLFMPYPVMLGLKFLCGFMGVNSATLREAAVQKRLPAEQRARVNSLLNMVCVGGILIVQLVAGALAEFLPFRIVSLLLASLAFLSIILFITRNRRAIGELYTGEER